MTVTDADREAVQKFLEDVRWHIPGSELRALENRVAAHREAAEQASDKLAAEWLRTRGFQTTDRAADAFERSEHRRK